VQLSHPIHKIRIGGRVEKGSETCIVHMVLSFIIYSMKKLLITMVFVLSLFSFASATSPVDYESDAILWMYNNGLTIHNNKYDFKFNN
jgi:hypothetical protein